MGTKNLKEVLDKFGITARAEAQGKAQGVREGKALGIREGKAQGIAQGIREGKAQGVREGKAQGIREGKVQGIVQGIREGKAQGVREGEERMAKKIAQNLIKIGLTSEKIAEVTKLDLATVESLMGRDTARNVYPNLYSEQ